MENSDRSLSLLINKAKKKSCKVIKYFSLRELKCAEEIMYPHTLHGKFEVFRY